MTFGARVAGAIAGIRFRGVVPLILMTTLIVALGAYTAVRQDAFLGSYNLNNLLLATMPLALVSMGQTFALLVGGFDVSVGALMTLCVVVASYTMTPTMSTPGARPGRARPGRRRARGRALQRAAHPRLPPAFDHRHARHASASSRARRSSLRDHPEGTISSDAIDTLTTSWGFVPLAFIGVVVLALLGDLWLYRTRTGMALRAVGLDETSARRIGIRTTYVVIFAFVACSVLASIAGFYLAAEVQIGSPIIGNQALESIAAGVLGGASLAGGRGSFFGALLAALFLSLIDNVLPLFHQPTEYAEMTIGILILAALILYQGPELLARLRTSWGGVGRLRARRGETPAG